MIVSLGDQVQHGEYVLHSRFERVINYVALDRIVSVVTKEVGGGPDNVVVTELAPFAEDQIIVDERMTQGVPRFDSHLKALDVETTEFGKGLRIFEELLLKFAPEKSLVVLLDPRREEQFRGGFETQVLRKIWESFALIRQGAVIDGLLTARGLGWGLTPCGDDLIAGVLMALKVRGVALEKGWMSLDNRESISLTQHLLMRTAQGLVSERWKKMFGALASGESSEIEQALHEVLQVGQTSGADTATGVLIGFIHIGIDPCPFRVQP